MHRNTPRPESIASRPMVPTLVPGLENTFGSPVALLGVLYEMGGDANRAVLHIDSYTVHIAAPRGARGAVLEFASSRRASLSVSQQARLLELGFSRAEGGHYNLRFDNSSYASRLRLMMLMQYVCACCEVDPRLACLSDVQLCDSLYRGAA